MLGSTYDADDAFQDTLLRAWRALPKFQGRSSLRTWLYRIATNVCLDAIARRHKRGLSIDYGPASRLGGDEPKRPLSGALWIEPYPDGSLDSADGEATPEARYERREALELAFVATLLLSPRQRAVLILRDVLGFSAKEVAEILTTTVASVNGALQRARRALDERRPERGQQAAPRSLGDTCVRKLVDRFANAFETGDVGAMLTLLAEGAALGATRPYATFQHAQSAGRRLGRLPATLGQAAAAGDALGPAPASTVAVSEQRRSA
jgi:RNA polymerase sigma-70 factor (ECF subfamily)